MRIWFGIAGPFVHVQAQNAREKILIDPLTVLISVPGTPFVAHRDVEVTVGPEMEIAAVVIGLLVVLIDQDHLRARVRLVRIVRLRLKSGKALV